MSVNKSITSNPIENSTGQHDNIKQQKFKNLLDKAKINHLYFKTS